MSSCKQGGAKTANKQEKVLLLAICSEGQNRKQKEVQEDDHLQLLNCNCTMNENN